MVGAETQQITVVPGARAVSALATADRTQSRLMANAVQTERHAPGLPLEPAAHPAETVAIQRPTVVLAARAALARGARAAVVPSQRMEHVAPTARCVPEVVLAIAVRRVVTVVTRLITAALGASRCLGTARLLTPTSPNNLELLPAVSRSRPLLIQCGTDDLKPSGNRYSFVKAGNSCESISAKYAITQAQL